MPVVTVDPHDYQRFELKSAPRDPNDPNDEDGFIMARPLPYGSKVKRRDRASKSTMRNEGKGRQASPVIEMDSFLEVNIKTDFAYCIGDHNLTDKEGVPIDFKNPMAFQSLDPKVGDEIEEILNTINGDIDKEAEEDFLNASTDS
jgi:hypothetical protein